MRMPRFRFTVRGLMIAVAIFGFAFQVTLWIQASRRYRGIAEGYSRQADESLRQAAYYEEGAFRDSERNLEDAEARLRWDRENEIGSRYVNKDIELVGQAREQLKAVGEIIAQFRLSSEHFRRLARKYRHAARYPWLPIEPDPPEPRIA